MRIRFFISVVIVAICASARSAQSSYLGFDRNDYPGDANLEGLRQTFSYTGYWLNNPPGASTNTWRGHRALVESAGFGFLVLFNGRLYDELKTVVKAEQLGKSDGKAAALAAKREGFPRDTIIFLDQEQGGRMLPEQKAYIYAWVDEVTDKGYRAGIYCSGIPASDDEKVVTANDIREHAGSRSIVYWAINDACPRAPGCAFPAHPPNPSESGVAFAEVWQYAQSPRRKDIGFQCTNYSRDGNCYPPGDALRETYVDVNTATSPDPSHGRTH